MTQEQSTTDTKPAVVEALAAVMADVRALGKADRNNQQGYNFRGIDSVMNAVGPSLRKHGVIIAPYQVASNYRDVQTSTGKASRECTVMVTYRIYGPAGDSIDVMAPGESMDFGDKGAPKAMSVAMRIVLLQTLCLPTDEKDPDAEPYERAAGHTNGQANGNGASPAARQQLMSNVVALGKAISMTPDALTADFQKRYGKEPAAASLQELTEYLGVLRYLKQQMDAADPEAQRRELDDIEKQGAA